MLQGKIYAGWLIPSISFKYPLKTIFNHRKCTGNSLKHDEHDPIFGGKKIYLACIGIWLTAFVALLPDIIGVS